MNWPFVNVKWDEILNIEAVEGAERGLHYLQAVASWCLLGCWFTAFLSLNRLTSREEIINFSELLLTRGCVSGVETFTRGHLRQFSRCKFSKNTHTMAAH